MEQPSTLPPYLMRVVRLLCDGMTEKEAAAKIGTAPHVVNQYIHRVYRRLGISSRLELYKLMSQERIAEVATI